ncbi:septal ring lytic transglycosylase RlpA family protein [Actinomadura oligospora]|uniref:septal ring lytic transglycosylase RlpA family protein n=1 Tax=Actinomadura oligospora TaxID=111804 RepID=UPI0004797B05|nr:septal ring lytic transglycosylase RlpA family protein [Actinomadura oligospora]
MGKHRPRFRLRTILVASGLAVAVLAAGAAALLTGGGSGGSADAAQARQAAVPPPTTPSQTPLADKPRAKPSKASRGAKRDPEPQPVEITQAPKAKPKPKKPKYTVLSSGACQASSYGEGQSTASGEPFDPSELTAAHKTLPFGSRVRVTNKNNGESVVVRINDRGPFVSGRCLDLSTAAMKQVDGMSAGVIPVRYEVLSRG